MTSLPSIWDISRLKHPFYALVYAAKGPFVHIIQNSQHNFWTWVWAPPPPPVWTMLKKNALFLRVGFPKLVTGIWARNSFNLVAIVFQSKRLGFSVLQKKRWVDNCTVLNNRLGLRVDYLTIVWLRSMLNFSPNEPSYLLSLFLILSFLSINLIFYCTNSRFHGRFGLLHFCDFGKRVK